MLRRNIIGLALLGCMTLAAAALVLAPSPEPARPFVSAATSTASAPQSRPGVVVAESATTCAGECQGQHDRCRVQTKGSPSCDAERQRCLEICLHKKRK